MARVSQPADISGLLWQDDRTLIPWWLVYVGGMVAAGVVSFLAAVMHDLQRQGLDLEILVAHRRVQEAQRRSTESGVEQTE